jgi:6-pyruvoyltetrahydropterin/6-carboxytetrahydropterin synthase
MPFRIAKSIVVESGHLLSKHPGACRFPHGHSRTIELVVVADVLNESDMVCDFASLKAAALTVCGRYDHAFALNTADPQYATLEATYGERIIGFVNTDPTTEVLAREIFRAAQARLGGPSLPGAGVVPTAHLRLERVRVTETASCWAEYWE